MAVDRKLTIASMKGRCWLQFVSEIGNLDAWFSSSCGGGITVSRSVDGRVYVVDCDVDHIRVVVTLRGPDDLPAIYWRGGTSSYGWWVVDGYQQMDFPPGLDTRDPTFVTADTIRNTDPARLGQQRQSLKC
jgi:hypothetical protein